MRHAQGIVNAVEAWIRNEWRRTRPTPWQFDKGAIRNDEATDARFASDARELLATAVEIVKLADGGRRRWVIYVK